MFRCPWHWWHSAPEAPASFDWYFLWSRGGSAASKLGLPSDGSAKSSSKLSFVSWLLHGHVVGPVQPPATPIAPELSGQVGGLSGFAGSLSGPVQAPLIARSAGSLCVVLSFERVSFSESSLSG